MIAGQVTFGFPTETRCTRRGDAFYAPPGHIAVKHQPGSEVVMFSPAEAIRETEAVMMKNMQAMQPG